MMMTTTRMNRRQFIESLGEAIALVGKAGVDPLRYVDILTSTRSAASLTRPTAG